MIETQRLKLRRFTPADLDWLAAMNAEPKTRGFLWDGPTNREAATRDLERWLAEYERGLGHLAMIHKPDDTPIGHCGLTEDEDSGRILLSYALREDYWCMGLAPETCRAVLRYAFEELGLDEVWTATRAENRAWRGMMERLGMTLRETAGEEVRYAAPRERLKETS